MYVCEKRVIRDGYLVAFEGEAMTEDEAHRRGLVEEPKPKRPARKRASKKAEDK